MKSDEYMDDGASSATLIPRSRRRSPFCRASIYRLRAVFAGVQDITASDVCVCVCVCVCVLLYLRIYTVDFDRTGFIFFFFFFFFFLFQIREENNFSWFTDSCLYYGEFLIFKKFIF